MEAPDVAKVNAENCYLNENSKNRISKIKNISINENGGCDKFIFDDSIMKSTIGRVFY